MNTQVVTTGCLELDELLDGGIGYGSSVIIRGGPGSGKTIFGLHFIAAAVRANDPALIISFAEPEDKIRQYASGLNIDISKAAFLDLTPTPDRLADNEPYEIFIPDDIEKRPITRSIVESIEKKKPKRVFIDGFSLFRYLYSDLYQYRRQIVALMRFLRDHGATAIFASEMTEQSKDEELAFAADSVLTLTRTSSVHYLSIEKNRAGAYCRGHHAFVITDTGVRMLLDIDHFTKERLYQPELVATSIKPIDEALGGGLYQGSFTVITGNPCSGKSTFAFAVAASLRKKQQKVGLLLLDETEQRFRWRLQRTNEMSCAQFDETHYIFEQIDHFTTFEEVAFLVRQLVEVQRCSIIVMDGLDALLENIPLERMNTSLRQLRAYAAKKGTLLFATVNLSHFREKVQSQSDIAIHVITPREFKVVHNRFGPATDECVTLVFNDEIGTNDTP